MFKHIAAYSLAALTLVVPATIAGAQSAPPMTPAPSPSPAGNSASPAGDSSPSFDVIANVLSAPQRKMLDRDARCGDARSATETFVNSAGKALQTGVDAMVALEKCATLPRVGSDWSDFRDYVITAAAALAYAVGSDAGDERLLHRATDDASHVSGYEAGNATTTSYSIENKPDRSLANDNGHSMGSGPAQSSERSVKDARAVVAYSGSYGRLATDIARAANARLSEIHSRPQAHDAQH